MADFHFVGPSYTAASPYQDAQECINWFPEVDPLKTTASQTNPSGDRGVTALYPTPGLLPRIQLDSYATVRCMWPLPGASQMLVISGSTVYLINAQLVATTVGSILSTSGIIYIVDNGLSAYIVDGINRYSYNIATQALAVISAGDGPFTGGDRADIVDGFILYNRPGTNQWGCTNVLSTVSNPLNFGSKGGSSDNIVSLIADHLEVYLLGERTAEVWANVGAFPFPFQRVPGTTSQHGCAAKDSVQRLGESIVFVSKDTRGRGIIVQSNGYFFQRISNHAVESDITKGIISDAIAYTYQQNGHEFYVLTFPTQDKTWVYDLATQLWHKRANRDNNNVLHRHRGNCVAVFQEKVLVGDYQNGLIYEMSLSTFTENGAALPRIRRCPHLTTDLKRQFFEDLQIQFQPGVGLQTGQGKTPKAMLRWSDDGGSTWSNEHWANIGKVGKYKNRAMWRRLGYARDRIFEVVVTDPIYAVVVSANLNASEGDS